MADRGGRRSTSWTKETVPKGGRTKGAKDKIPRPVRASIAAIFQDITSTEPEMIRKAIEDGLKA